MSSTRIAIVTGGGSGIGRATALRLSSDGYHVVVCGRDISKLEDTAARCSGPVTVHAADLSSSEAARGLVAAVAAEHGRLDALVNAHGVIGPIKLIDELDDSDWDEVLDTNLLAPIRTITAAVPLLEQTGGSVVNVLSINALQGEPYVAPYGVSKTGLMGFGRYAAIELGPRGIRVNSVLPGWVRTPMSDPFFEELGLVGKPIATNIVQRPAEPEEIAGVVAFLVGPDATFLSGECIVADGGQSIKLTPLTEATE